MDEHELRRLEKLAAQNDPSASSAVFEFKRKMLPVLQISASQLESYEGNPESCNRKWAFESIWKLPKVEKGSQAFGSILHSVVERFLDSDDQGYRLNDDGTSSKEAIELYPEGWQGNLDDQEAEIIKQLVVLAEEEGLLERFPGRKVEYQFLGPVTEHVRIKGFIDLLCVLQGIVIDHKSTSNFRWAKSAEKLRTNTQMMVYGKVLIGMAQDLGIDHKSIILRHNQFQKDPFDIRVKKTEVVVSVREIEDHWEWIKKKAEEMRLWRDKIHLTDESLSGISPTPGLKKTTWKEVKAGDIKACHAFGGCSFLQICGGIETQEAYRSRVTKYIEKQAEQAAKKLTIAVETAAKQEKSNMGVISRSKSQPEPTPVVSAPAPAPAAATPARIVIKKSTTAPPVTTTSTTTPPVTISGFVELTKDDPLVVNGAVAVKEPKPPLVGVLIPPWANADCNACGGSGMNTKGYICPICDSAGGNISDQYDIKVDKATGKLLSFTAKNGGKTIDISSIQVVATSEDTTMVLSEEDKKDDGIESDDTATVKPTKSGSEGTGTADGSCKAFVRKERKRGRVPPEAECVCGKPRKEHGETTKTAEVEETSTPTITTTTIEKAAAKVEPIIQGTVAIGSSTQAALSGFILCIDCVPISKTINITDGMEILNRVGAELAAELGQPSYYSLNAFARRDALASRAAAIAKTLSGVVILTTDNVESKEFAAQLGPYASMVVRG